MMRGLILILLLATSGQARDLHGGAPVDYWIDLSVVSTPRTTSTGSSSSVTVSDQVLTRYTTAQTQDDKRILAAMTISKGGVLNGSQPTFSSSNTSVATVDSSGAVTHVNSNTSGAATITATNAFTSASIPVTFTRVLSTTTDTFANYASGSLSRHIADDINGRLTGKTAGTATQNLFSSGTTRNTDNILANVDLSCIASNTWAGTLISPRHFIQAAHVALTPGVVLTFVSGDGNNTVITRTCVGNNTSGGADINVGILASDVPSGFTYARFLPANYLASSTNKFPSVTTSGATTFPTNSAGLPAVGINQYRQVSVREVAQINNAWLSFSQPTIAKRLEFYQNMISGDSGSPAFLIINNTPVLLTTWYSGGAGAGPSDVNYLTQINSAMHALSVAAGASTDYQVTTVNLSGFTSW